MLKVMISQISILLFVSLLSLSSESFWTLWVSLELYSFFLLPFLMESESKVSKTNIFFYFLMQFMASTWFLISSISMVNMTCLMLLLSSLLVKMSCFPFHTWFIEILPFISWKKVLILTTLSKVLPLTMLSLFMPPKGCIWVLVGGVVVSLGGFMMSCLRKLVAYSSVAHASWLVICSCMSKTLSLMYISAYIISSLPLCVYFMTENLMSMKAVLSAKKGVMQLIILTLVLSGVPPFLGFIPKLLAIVMLVQNLIFLEAAALGLVSILPVYFYFKMGLSSFNMKSSLEFCFTKSLSFTVVLTLVCSVVAMLLLMLSLSLLY